MEKMSLKKQFIDVHHHYNPLYKTRLPELLRGKLDTDIRVSWDIQKDLEIMTENNISRAILSYPTTHNNLSAKEEISLASMINESFATLTAKYRKLGAFAFLPLQDIDMSLSEVSYALDTLNLDGVYLPTSFSDKYLGNDYFKPLYEDLNARKALVFIHPTSFKEDKNDKNVNPLMRSMNEVTRAACDLVFKGVLHKYPNIRFILSYGGGNISFFSSRIIKGNVYPELNIYSGKKNFPLGAEHYMKQFYYDTALPIHTNVLNCLKSFVNRSQILYGSDYPHSTLASIQQSIAHVQLTQYTDQVTLADSCKRNTLQLLGLN